MGMLFISPHNKDECKESYPFVFLLSESERNGCFLPFIGLHAKMQPTEGEGSLKIP